MSKTSQSETSESYTTTEFMKTRNECMNINYI